MNKYSHPNRYSHPLLFCRMAAKRDKISLNEALNNAKKYFQSLDDNYVNQFSKKDFLNFLVLEKAVIMGDCLHVFIKDNSVMDLLTESEVKISSSFNDLFENSPYELFESKNGPIGNVLVINSKKYNISPVIGYWYINNDLYIYMLINKNFQFACRQLLNSDIIDTFKNTDVNVIPFIKLLYNLIFYSKSFPDKVIDGTPSDFKEVGLHNANKKRSLTIEPHEKIIDRSGVTPHFRRGHFAKLESSRYVNKRGQIIWISEAMVKGYKAKTVIE